MLFLLVPLLFSLLKFAVSNVSITYLSNSKSSGAVCLDGSPPAYHLAQGDASRWHINLEGGGWCSTIESCAERSKNRYGSSIYMNTTALFNGILSTNAQVNPDFYNWTHVHVRYCDGASFSADVEEPLKVSSGQVLYFRGKRILKAVVDELKTKGLSEASEVLLTGCSAGGLATIVKCNDFRSFFPQSTKVKCVADGGFFLNASDITGTYYMSQYYNNVVTLHNLQTTLDSSCVASHDATKCFFPQFMQEFVQTPLFIVNTAYDVWQLDNVVRIDRKDYIACANFSSTSCPSVHTLQDFRENMVKDLSFSLSKPTSGVFLNSCFAHCQLLWNDRWNKPKINGQSVSQTVGDWYFERQSSVHLVDCAYPCNPTCTAVEFY